MKAMILAAGMGSRFKPYTYYIPKPLLLAGKKRIIEYHLFNLAKAGISEIIINISYMYDKFYHILKNGEDYGLSIKYSEEPYPPLETAGGIINALPELGDDWFILINGDIYTDYPLTRLIQIANKINNEYLAYLVLTDNPYHNPSGDFSLSLYPNLDNKQKETLNQINCILPNSCGFLNYYENKLTYTGIGIYRKKFFDTKVLSKVNTDFKEKVISTVNNKNIEGKEHEAKKLRYFIDQAIKRKVLIGEYYSGRWLNIDNNQRLSTLN